MQFHHVTHQSLCRSVERFRTVPAVSDTHTCHRQGLICTFSVSLSQLSSALSHFLFLFFFFFIICVAVGMCAVNYSWWCSRGKFLSWVCFSFILAFTCHFSFPEQLYCSITKTSFCDHVKQCKWETGVELTVVHKLSSWTNFSSVAKLAVFA